MASYNIISQVVMTRSNVKIKIDVSCEQIAKITREHSSAAENKIT